MTDTQLLARFVAQQDETAFRDLVVRHGPTVLRACRRTLQDPHEIEDTFQAVFLVLVRKAPTIRDPEFLGNWLYGVANRIASRSRRGLQRRRKHEQRRAEIGAPCAVADRPWDDVGRAIREELGGLPEPYRAPLELCYLQGLGHEEAARALGWPLGTLKTRLVRGRRRLRERLDRRGLAPGLALLLLLLPRRASAVPQELVDKTVESMRLEPATGRSVPQPDYERFFGLPRTFLVSRRVSCWMWSLVSLLVLSILATECLALYGQGLAAEAAEFAELPAGLMDVLGVECR